MSKNPPKKQESLTPLNLLIRSIFNQRFYFGEKFCCKISCPLLSMAFMKFLSSSKKLLSFPSGSASGLASFSTKSNPYIVKVGIPEFLTGIGKGVDKHVEKLESEVGDLQKLLVTRTLKLKKLGIPCKERKLILKYAHKYRLGLWRPRAMPVKSS